MSEATSAKIRAPRSLNEAQRLCEGFVAVDEQIVAIEAARDAAIAKANAAADAELAPLLLRRAAIKDKLAPWWADNQQLLTKGKRKSAELGGVVLASTAGRVSVSVSKSIDEVIAGLRGSAWGKALLRTRVELDKAAVATALLGKHGVALTALGLSLEQGPDVFSIKRTAQAGTQAKVQG
jgi:Bacteriophage Mu Gam like protein